MSLTPKIDAAETNAVLPSYGVRRIWASLLGDSGPEGVEVTLIDDDGYDLEKYVRRIEAYDPDVVGFSVYVWSMPFFLRVAKQLRENDPSRLLVIGGPSARTSMFSIPEYREFNAILDAIVIKDGEFTFNDIVAAKDRSPAGLAAIAGVALPQGGLGWRTTPARPPVEDVNTITSPYQLGLDTRGAAGEQFFAYLETYRGCPLSCTFCEWGDADRPKTVFSQEYLVRELAAIKALGATTIYNVDAALNLNSRAFKNLCAADAEVGLFKDVDLSIEVYPSHLQAEHLDFIRKVRTSWVGIGLQSFDKEVLRQLERPFREDVFERAVLDLSQISPVDVQLILGLPGDNPDSFKRTIDRAMKLPASMHVYHSLVLPDALLTRSPAHFDLRFDPTNMKMISCWGWSERELRETGEWLAGVTRNTGGRVGNWYYSLPPPAEVLKQFPDSAWNHKPDSESQGSNRSGGSGDSGERRAHMAGATSAS